MPLISREVVVDPSDAQVPTHEHEPDGRGVVGSAQDRLAPTPVLIGQGHVGHVDRDANPIALGDPPTARLDPADRAVGVPHPIANGELPILGDRSHDRVAHHLLVFAQDRRDERLPSAVVAPRRDSHERLELRRPDAVLLDRVPSPRAHPTRRERQAGLDRALAKLLLAVHARRDVDRDADPLAYDAELVAHGRAASLDPAHLAVGADDAVLHHEVGFVGGGAFDGRSVELAILRVDRSEVRLEVAAERAGLHAVQALELGRPHDEIGARVPPPRAHLARGKRQSRLDVTVVGGRSGRTPRARGHPGSHTPIARDANPASDFARPTPAPAGRTSPTAGPPPRAGGPAGTRP